MSQHNHLKSAPNRRTFLRGAGAGVLGAGLLAGCSTDRGGDTSGKVELRLWGLTHAPHVEQYKEYIASFNQKHPEITIKHEQFEALQDQLQRAFASRQAPDLVTTHTGMNLLFNQSGVFAPLESSAGFDDAFMERFFPSLVDGFSYDNVLYGLPMGNNTPGIGMVADLDAADEAGVEIPDVFESWDQVWDAAKALTVTDASGRITRAGLNVRASHSLQYIAGFMFELGAQLFDSDAGVFQMSSPEGERALQLLVDASLLHKVDSTRLALANEGLGDKSSAMVLTYVDYIPYAQSQFTGRSFGFAVRPPIEGSDLVVASEGGWGLSATAGSKNLDAAMLFVEHVAEEQNLRDWYQSQNCPPPAPEFIEDDFFLPGGEGEYLQPVLDTLPESRIIGKYPIWEMNTVTIPIFDKVHAGSITVAAACQQIDAACNAAFQRYVEQVNDFSG